MGDTETIEESKMVLLLPEMGGDWVEVCVDSVTLNTLMDITDHELGQCMMTAITVWMDIIRTETPNPKKVRT